MEAKVKDYPGLIKRNGGVINTNRSEYVQAKMRYNQAKRLDRLEENVSSMEGKLSEIMFLLQKLSVNYA